MLLGTQSICKVSALYFCNDSKIRQKMCTKLIQIPTHMTYTVSTDWPVYMHLWILFGHVLYSVCIHDFVIHQMRKNTKMSHIFSPALARNRKLWSSLGGFTCINTQLPHTHSWMYTDTHHLMWDHTGFTLTSWSPTGMLEDTYINLQIQSHAEGKGPHTRAAHRKSPTHTCTFTPCVKVSRDHTELFWIYLISQLKLDFFPHTACHECAEQERERKGERNKWVMKVRERPFIPSYWLLPCEFIVLIL